MIETISGDMLEPHRWSYVRDLQCISAILELY